MKNSGLSEKDYGEMMYMNFNKYQINLSDELDKTLFKNFLNDSLNSEKEATQQMFPEAGNREQIKGQNFLIVVSNKQKQSERSEQIFN